MSMVVYFDGETCHAAWIHQRKGEALCGFPPRRPDGTQWLMSDTIPETAADFLGVDEVMPLVDCQWCYEAYRERETR